jgi:serine/threonine-protein kinase RsbW
MSDPAGEFVIPSDLEAARRVQDRIESVVKPAFNEHDAFAIKMAVEEALVNAIKHGNQMDPDKSVRVAYALQPETPETPAISKSRNPQSPAGT